MSAPNRRSGPRYTKYFKVPVPDDMHEKFTGLAEDSLLASCAYIRTLMGQHLKKVEAAEAAETAKVKA